MDHDGKLLGWAQTSPGQGQTGCLIHSLACRKRHVLIKGSVLAVECGEITFKE
jgi:hypothetical protein